MTKHDYGSKRHWDDLLIREFKKESDRAAVLLTTSLLDNAALVESEELWMFFRDGRPHRSRLWRC